MNPWVNPEAPHVYRVNRREPKMYNLALRLAQQVGQIVDLYLQVRRGYRYIGSAVVGAAIFDGDEQRIPFTLIASAITEAAGGS
jgi:hypothetical protein